MELSIFDVIYNGISNEEISKCIEKKLYEKYNEEFSVKMIGNRYGTFSDDTVTTFCYPKSNENLIFTAVLNKDQTKLEDDYILRNISFELEKYIKDEFEKENINVINKSEIVGINKLEKSLPIQDFITNYSTTNFLSHIIIKSSITDEILEKVFQSIKSKFPNIHLKALLYIIDEEDYSNFYNISNSLPSLTTSIINQFSIKAELIIKIFEGNIIRIK